MTTKKEKEWQQVIFDEVIEHSAFGPRFSGDHYADDGNVVTLRTTDISESGEISYGTTPRANLNENKFIDHFLKIGDLVITRSGRVGTAAVFAGHAEPVLPGAFLIRFRLRGNANPYFYRYYFNSKNGRQRLLSVSRGAAQQNINVTNVRTLRVPCPTRPQQDAIVSFLSTYDDLIENSRRRIELLEEAARQLYKEWFVRFRFPGHEHVKIIDGVPEGWTRKALRSVLTLNYGKALKADDRREGPYPVFGSSGNVGSHDKPLVKGPGIVLGRKGNVGSVYWVHEDFWPIDTVYFINAEESDYFTYFALLATPFISTDVAVPGLNRDFAYSREIVIPSATQRGAFVEAVSPLFAQAKTLKAYCAKLQEARDLLLPKLMSGEIAA